MDRYERMLELYIDQFVRNRVELPKGAVSKFYSMYYSSTDRCIIVAPKPPGGWANFNSLADGLPWYGAK